MEGLLGQWGGRRPEPEFHTCDGAAMTPDKQSEPPARRALREAEGLLFENSRCTTSDVPIGDGRSIHTIQLKLRDDERGAPALVMLPGYGLRPRRRRVLHNVRGVRGRRPARRRAVR